MPVSAACAEEAAIRIGGYVEGTVPMRIMARSADGWLYRPVTETRTPPEVRLLLPTRSRRLLGETPLTQCRAVTAQFACTTEAPQRWLPDRFCMDAMNE